MAGNGERRVNRESRHPGRRSPESRRRSRDRSYQSEDDRNRRSNYSDGKRFKRDDSDRNSSRSSHSSRWKDSEQDVDSFDNRNPRNSRWRGDDRNAESPGDEKPFHNSRWKDNDRESPWEGESSSRSSRWNDLDSELEPPGAERDSYYRDRFGRNSRREVDERNKGSYSREDDRQFANYSSDSYDSTNLGPGEGRHHDNVSGDGRSYKHNANSGNFVDSVTNYKTQKPSNQIMLKGLAQHITESEIRQDILQCSLLPVDIRIIRRKDTGTSRGFAFVEFNTLQEASRWIEIKQGVLLLQGDCRAIMQYNVIHTENSMDWVCNKCGAFNFKRRESCFKCFGRPGDEPSDSSKDVNRTLTSMLVLRGLDVLTTEEGVAEALKTFSAQAPLSVRLGRDTLTKTSRGVCYVQLATPADATALYDALQAQPPTIDGRKVSVLYHRPSYVPAHQMAPSDVSSYSVEDVPRLAEYSATMYATTPQEHAAYLLYYQQHYKALIEQGTSITTPMQSDSVNAAAALAQSAIQQAMAAKEFKKMLDPSLAKPKENLAYELFKVAHQKILGHSAPSVPPHYYPSMSHSYTPSHASTGTYPVPDVSTYQYDQTSGYYYDPLTGLYYDSTTQYYYNSQAQQFMYWDSERLTYLPAPNAGAGAAPPVVVAAPALAAAPPPPGAAPPAAQAATVAQAGAEAAAAAPKEVVNKSKEKDKSKTAKKIAKDMERWAKALKQKKESVAPQQTVSVGAADAGYAVLEGRDRALAAAVERQEALAAAGSGGGREREAAAAGGGGRTGAAAGLVANYGGQSESDGETEEGQADEQQHISWETLACILCKRQFINKETLARHQQQSDLHKQNVSAWNAARRTETADSQQQQQQMDSYRDRAKERRLKFGEPNAPKPNRLKEKFLKSREDAVSISYEEPTKAGIGNDNLGNKMLQKMGWSEGMGLGKANQGRTSIIQPKQRASSAGLGAKGGTYGALPGETYKDCVKKMMIARYQELEDQE